MGWGSRTSQAQTCALHRHLPHPHPFPEGEGKLSAPTASRVRRYCERNTARFVREMGNPANFGMAKSLFGAAGGLEPGAARSPEGLATLMSGVADVPPDVISAMLDEMSDSGPPVVEISAAGW